MKEPIIKDFIPGIKVLLGNEFGVVLEDNRNGYYGLIRWDTAKEYGTEDWIGLFGTFVNAGGKILAYHKFKYINDDGSLKDKI